MTGPRFDFSHLTEAERLDLIGDLWDSLDREGTLEMTPEFEAELDRRLAEMHANPDSGRTWEEVRADLIRRLH